MKQRRPRLELYAAVVKRSAVDAQTFTRLMVYENLSAKLTKEILHVLVRNGLMEEITEEGRRVFQSTNAGLEFLASYVATARMVQG